MVKNVVSTSCRCLLLTHDLEMNILADVRCGRYLAFVDARIPDLWVLDLQRPILAGRLIDGPEPLVSGVRIPTNGQQVDVPVPDPGDLKREKRKGQRE